jgi:hypothetical protein
MWPQIVWTIWHNVISKMNYSSLGAFILTTDTIAYVIFVYKFQQNKKILSCFNPKCQQNFCAKGTAPPTVAVRLPFKHSVNNVDLLNIHRIICIHIESHSVFTVESVRIL